MQLLETCFVEQAFLDQEAGVVREAVLLTFGLTLRRRPVLGLVVRHRVRIGTRYQGTDKRGSLARPAVSDRLLEHAVALDRVAAVDLPHPEEIREVLH